MFDTVVIATDGSASATRAVDVALDFARRFDAAVYALCVVEERDVAGSPEELREDLATALESAATEALDDVRERADRAVVTTVREGRPASEIVRYAAEVDADVVVAGTRGRHGANGLVLGSVAEKLVRNCDQPVMTVRQLADADDASASS